MFTSTKGRREHNKLAFNSTIRKGINLDSI
jgi:hypothetical protein